MSDEAEAAVCLHCSTPVEPGAVVCERAGCIAAADTPRLRHIFSPGAPAITLSWCMFRWPGDVSDWREFQGPDKKPSWSKVEKFVTRYVTRWR